MSEVEVILNELKWAEGVGQELDEHDTLEVSEVNVDMATAENILDESAWLFHSDWSEQCKSEARTIETEADGQTAALTGHNPRGDIRPMVKDQVRGRIS